MSQADAQSRTARRGAVKTTWLWLFAGLAALAAYLGSFTVRAGEVAVVARFGDPRRLVEEPGLHFKWPAPVDSVFRVDMRTSMLDPEPEEFLTSDQKNVDVDAFVAWRVADPQQFLKSLRDRTGAEDKIGQVLKSTLVEVLNSGPFDDLVSLEANRERTLSDVRQEITAAVAERCAQNGYGVEIEMAGIERINFPTDNRPAVEAAMRTTREKEAREIAAQGNEVANDIMTKAKSEAATITTTAEADAATIVGSGIAEANRIEAASRALNPELFDIVARHEVARMAFRGADLILGTDHWLLRTFDDPAERSSSKNGGTKSSSGEDGDQ